MAGISEVDPFIKSKGNLSAELNNKALLRQIFMSLMSIGGPLIVGACYSQPTVTINQLTDPSEPAFLTKDQASWYGEFYVYDIRICFDTNNCIVFSCLTHDYSSAGRVDRHPTDGQDRKEIYNSDWWIFRGHFSGHNGDSS